MNTSYFSRARDSFEFILTKKIKDKKILIPAYIGYSSNEGSGIFDPIKNSATQYKFYKLDKNLDINKDYLFKLIDKNEGNILLLVHYFGFIDDNIQEIKNYAKQKNMIIVEDCAHAFFTFFKKPIIDSDYYIFSLHKMFPHAKGGMCISKKPLNTQDTLEMNPFEYNLYEISEKRVQNYNYLKNKLELIDDIKILRPTLNDTVPQTLPVLVENEDIRDNLYFKLNELGFGVVSLYHELIKEVELENFQDEDFLSKHILNFPVHQDVSTEDIDKIIECIIDNKLLKSSK
ncbi:DegT/DnrJ/EryC1/StrS family aminotransferase [Sulfurimonas sp.]